MNSFNLLGRQNGFSSLCFFSTLVFLSFFGFMGIKLAPSYLDFRVVSNAVDEVSRMKGITTMRRPAVISRIRESVHRNSGVSAPTMNLDDVIYVASRDGSKVVGTNYEVVVDLFYNVSALLHFKHEKVINPYK